MFEVPERAPAPTSHAKVAAAMAIRDAIPFKRGPRRDRFAPVELDDLRVDHEWGDDHTCSESCGHDSPMADILEDFASLTPSPAWHKRLTNLARRVKATDALIEKLQRTIGELKADLQIEKLAHKSSIKQMDEKQARWEEAVLSRDEQIEELKAKLSARKVQTEEMADLRDSVDDLLLKVQDDADYYNGVLEDRRCAVELLAIAFHAQLGHDGAWIACSLGACRQAHQLVDDFVEPSYLNDEGTSYGVDLGTVSVRDRLLVDCPPPPTGRIPT